MVMFSMPDVKRWRPVRAFSSLLQSFATVFGRLD